MARSAGNTRRTRVTSPARARRPRRVPPAENEWDGDETGEVAAEQEAIARSIVTAQQAAGRDNRGFVDALNASFSAFRAAPAGPAGALRMAAPAPTAAAVGAHILSDPRYLANSRALAARTLGGDRVIGGVPVKSPNFLDCVAVGNDAEFACSGTLIGPNVVVTAGHCSEFATRVFFGYDVEKAGKQVRVRSRVRHPDYHGARHHDLMVLVLAETVTTVSPRALASKAAIDAATDGRIVGFGHVDAGGSFGYGIKRMVDVPIASPNCAGSISGQSDAMSYGCDKSLELVAGRPLLERDSCKGDSGGPLYVLDAGGQWLLAAATSRATDSAMHTCGDGGIYVRLDRYRSWIASIPGARLL